MVRAAIADVRFGSDSRRAFWVPLDRNLPNESHVVEIVASGDGEVIVDGLWITEPPWEQIPVGAKNRSLVSAGSVQAMFEVTVGTPALARLPRVPGTNATP